MRRIPSYVRPGAAGEDFQVLTYPDPIRIRSLSVSTEPIWPLLLG